MKSLSDWNALYDNNFGKYYCLGHYRDNYRALQNYRLEYMTNLAIEDENSVPIEQVKGLENFERVKKASK